MNYKKHYHLLIERAKSRVVDQELVTERHHIIPRCLGGNDDNDNLVKLTPEEHFFAHQLLVKIHPNEPKLVYAANMMTVGSKNNKRSNNKTYGWLRKKYIKACKLRKGSDTSSFGKKWYCCPVTGANGKFADDAIPTGWISGRIVKKTTICIVCGINTFCVNAKWCDKCRPSKKTVFRNNKTKESFTDIEKEKALIDNNGSIRKALFSLGLNDSGVHYRKMKEIKARVYPPATNRSKG
jgi:hypothetical protein